MAYKILLGALLPVLFLNSACTIKTIIVDRHTLMEAESAGQWPDIDKKVLAQSKKKGATFFKKEDIRGKMAKPYQVLNSEPVVVQK